jgi:hypothetical protein
MEHPGNLQSSIWMLGEYKYKGMDKMRTKTIEYVYIYGYVSFALGVLLLIGLIVFMWIALRKIRNIPAR